MLHALVARIPATVDFVPIFEQSTISAVLDHMNNDHPEDNLLIVRAFATKDAANAVMTDLDDTGGTWSYEAGDAAAELTVPWGSGAISERGEIRREIVALYDIACERLDVTPRPH
jgi:hypothetical protein